mmetsp:Transcript_16170/g.34177  ORF Transcript_16170/g.34177 Transcript_16170/m.34177 type:complete len:297 (-) Transcript_16170:647-1537(-)
MSHTAESTPASPLFRSGIILALSPRIQAISQRHDGSNGCHHGVLHGRRRSRPGHQRRRRHRHGRHGHARRRPSHRPPRTPGAPNVANLPKAEAKTKIRAGVLHRSRDGRRTTHPRQRPRDRLRLHEILHEIHGQPRPPPKKRGDRPGARNPDPHAVGGGPRRARDGTPPPPHLPGVGHQNQGGHDGDADQEADSQEPARQGGAHGEQPPTGHQHRQAVSGAGAQHAGPVSGGHLGPHPRVRKVRSREGVPVLHLRHVVDQAGDHARHRRSGADHPPPRAHSRPAGDCSKDGAGPPE